MDFKQIQRQVIARLDEADRGDRGWFIITRVHTSVNWIKGIAEYLLTRGDGKIIRPTASDYERISQIVAISSTDPGIQLRRHHLLVMEKPLQLISRKKPGSWQNGLLLTQRGQELANSDDPSAILEASLREIQFAEEPWSPPKRVQKYKEFDVPVYLTTEKVLEGCDGFIDRDEFDLFLSRIRNQKEVNLAVKLIRGYRELTDQQKQSLLEQVELRIPSSKAYQNWRDISLHTFSLFSLGTSMLRDRQKLLQVATWVLENSKKSARKIRAKVKVTSSKELRIPEPPESQDLLAPPTTAATNDGSDGESFVAKILRSQGWQVAFYTNRRGFGFDLWGRRESKAMLVEVKSSLRELTTITLTETEYRAAKENKENYILALVENLDTEHPTVTMVPNPIKNLNIEERKTTSYTIPRSEWKSFTKGSSA